jgi:adenylate cyclase
VNVHTSAGVRFGGFLLDRTAGGLFRLGDHGRPVPVSLGSRALDVLGVLVERQGSLVSKQTIMDAVWPDTSVEENNLTVQISALRRVLDKGRTGGSCIQTVPGRGYRFIEPTDPFAGQPGRSAPIQRQVGLRQEQAARLSIVVLPFANLGGDRSEDYLADAITDDLTTELAHIPQALVIANASARSIRSKNLEVRLVGQELGVRYVLEGSARRIGSSLRINVRLISTETGAQLWADRFDQGLFELGSGQDEVLARIRAQLGLSLVEIEAGRSRRERLTNPDAFDLILRARWWSNQPPSQRRMHETQALYEQALRLDPDSVIAMTGLANVLSERNMNWAGQWLSADSQQLAVKLVADALAIAPLSEAALVAQVRLMHGQTQFRELLEPSQQLVERYPNNPEGYHHLARAMQFEGRFSDAVTLFERAIRLDPLEPRIFQRYGFVGFSLMQAGRYDDSAAWFARAVEANRDAPPALVARRYRNMSASLALAGRMDEARQAAAEAERLWPFDTVRSHYPLDPRSPALVAHEYIFRRGLRLAGVRDHAEEEIDFGVPPDNLLHIDLAGQTPISLPGADTIRTADLVRMLEGKEKPIVLDTVMNFWGRSLPGAVGLKHSGLGGTLDDQIQDRLRRKMTVLTNGDLATPIVAVGFNSERFDGRNLALRLVALAYTQVYWYRGGREAWEVNGLPETELNVQQW